MSDGAIDLQREIEGLLPLWIPALVHRLNNSLAVIHGAARFADAAAPDPGGQEEFEHARRLLRQLSLLARTPPARVEDLDLCELLEGLALLARPLLGASGIELELRLPTGAVPVRADAAQLRRLLALLVARGLGGVPRGDPPRSDPPRSDPPRSDPSMGERGHARLSLAVRAGAARIGGAVRLARAEQGGGLAPRAALWAAGLGASLARRDGPLRRAWRLCLPSLARPVEPPRGASPGARVSLCVGDAALAELLVLVLEHEGYQVARVRPEDAAPGGGVLVLETALFAGRPQELAALLGRWPAEGLLLIGEAPRAGLSRIACVAPACRPGELLAALRALRPRIHEGAPVVRR